MSRGRVEAFSDGVIAVAITLLVLDLHISPEGKGSLAHQIGSSWPTYASYLVTFFVIGVIWVNHHALFGLVARVDRLLLFYNLLLLLSVTTLPFTTSVLADYLRVGGGDGRLAVVLYGAVNELMALAFALILSHMIKADLLHEPVPRAQGRAAVWRFGLGLFVYPLVTIVGFISPPVMLVLYALTTVYYIHEQTPILGQPNPSGDSVNSPD